ncbi:MAG: glycerol kinase GlpK [Candidatus Omnitrophota bacterium]
MIKKYILAIDQGTTGSRAFVFDVKGRIIANSYKEFKQFFPKPGWVEHDADEIWNSCAAVIKQALRKGNVKPQQILTIGITNQRETTVIWDRKTSKPVSRAIVWQCRRTAKTCEELKAKGLQDVFRKKTGLVLDPYFSGTKIKWLLDNVPGLRRRAQNGEVCFGTIDSWLIWKLTGGKSHITDFTNASRTLLFDIKAFHFDAELLKILNIPREILPQVQNSGSLFGKTYGAALGGAGLISGIPITGVMGDQQAALFGQGCYLPGTVKNTYGTGCFIVLNTGHKLIYSKNGLLTTLACDDQGKPVYALEGSIFIGGAVIQWLRDQLGAIKNSSETENAIKGILDTNGVYFVPAFVGLGAPYWNAQARGIIVGLTRGANRKHIIRAALESIAYQTKDVFDLMQNESGQTITEIKVDGGACRNNFLMQFQADILPCKVIRPKTIESTAQGVAHLAGVAVGLWKGKEDLKKLYVPEKVFCPKMKSAQRNQLYYGWQKAVRQTLSV